MAGQVKRLQGHRQAPTPGDSWEGTSWESRTWLGRFSTPLVKGQEEGTKRVGEPGAVHHQGCATREDILKRPISWVDLLKMPQARLSFLLRVTYDTLPCPRNLHQEESCPLCSALNTSLHHLMSGCKSALTQGRYRWRHDQVLTKLAEVLESCRQDANNQPQARQLPVKFVRPGEGRGGTRRRGPRSVLSQARDWRMRADIGKQVQFPLEITTTFLQPDIVLWSAATRSTILIELTIPWEE